MKKYLDLDDASRRAANGVAAHEMVHREEFLAGGRGSTAYDSYAEAKAASPTGYVECRAEVSGGETRHWDADMVMGSRPAPRARF